MHFNYLAISLAALVPILIGFVWYHPKVMGSAWMNAAKLTEVDLKGGNRAVILLVSFLLSFLLAFEMNFITIHQYHIYSAMMDMANPTALDDPSSALSMDYAAFMSKYGTNFRTFKHGAFHGVLTGFFFILPIVGINALFERRGWKYIGIHVVYWTSCLALMGGIVCGWV